MPAARRSKARADVSRAARRWCSALNVQNTGQGHATVFPRLVAERLGIPAEKIPHRHGDSSLETPRLRIGRLALGDDGRPSLVKAIDTMLAKGKPIAATMLEAGEADIAYKNGRFEVVGTDRRVVAVRGRGARRRDEEARRDRRRPRHQDHDRDAADLPERLHIAEVEIDPDTGHMTIVTYTAVDDCGKRARPHDRRGPAPRLARAGLGQALMENIVYDSDSGQLVTGSFMDYAMPRADDMPPFRDALLRVPATTNPLGVKGVGEAGTTAAIAAVMNAVADAIPGGAGAQLDMPASAQRLWEACQRAKLRLPRKALPRRRSRRYWRQDRCVGILISVKYSAIGADHAHRIG